MQAVDKAVHIVDYLKVPVDNWALVMLRKAFQGPVNGSIQLFEKVKSFPG